MSVREEIERYIAGHPETKRGELEALHKLIRRVAPRRKLWFNDGKGPDGKTVANPSIGYGSYTIHYADGTSREFYRIGLSATTTGISVYVLGLKDKAYLAKTFGKQLGKATVTGYCIKFKTLKAINVDALEAAIRYGFDA